VNPVFVWATALKDLRRRARDPVALVLWLGIPLVIVSLILLAFGGNDRPPIARVLIENRDSSLVARLLIDALERSPVIQTEAVASSVARQEIDKGGATALLVIPKGFGSAVLDGDSTTLQLVTNPAQRILPGIVEENLGMVADAGFYLQRLFGDEVKTFMGGPPTGQFAFPQGEITGATARINRTIGRIGPYIMPPVVTLETKREVQDTGQSLGLGALFFPGVLFMSLLFMASGLASDVWQEAELGTLRRVITTPQNIAGFLAGKLLAGAILICGVVLAALLVGVWAFQVKPLVIPVGLLWATFSGVVFLMGLTLIQLHASSARTAGTLTTMIIFPLLMVGGSFFPFESMPAGLARFGRLTPNGWALTQLKAILWGGVEPGSIAIAFAGLVAVGLVAFWISARRLQRGFVTS